MASPAMRREQQEQQHLASTTETTMSGRRRRGREAAGGGAGGGLAWALATLGLLVVAPAGCWAFQGGRVAAAGGPGGRGQPGQGGRGLLRMSTAAAPEPHSSSSSSGFASNPSASTSGSSSSAASAAVSISAAADVAAAGADPLQGTLLERAPVSGGGDAGDDLQRQGEESLFYHYVLPPFLAAGKALRGRAGQRQQEQAEAAAAAGTAVGVISHHEALELLCLREGVGGRGGKRGFYYHEGVSLDLGRSETMVVVSEEGIALPAIRDRSRRGRPALVAAWEELEEIVALSQAGQLGCYALYADGTRPWKISVVSLKTGRAANLLPSRYVKGPPTVVLGSFLMHRLDGPRPGTYIGPAEDTRRKLDAIKMKKVYGRVLDTTMGLGYTAIAAARCPHVAEVVTIEADTASLEMCRYNPWSSDLFRHSQRPAAGDAGSFDKGGDGGSGSRRGPSPIQVLHGDVCELVKGFRDGHFAAVMHDPPAMALGGKSSSGLYSSAFYAELYRVLRWRGRLFHFVGGNPKTKEAGRLYKTVAQRLEAAGFKKVMVLASAQGIVAEKGEDRKSKKLLHGGGGRGLGGGGGGAGGGGAFGGGSGRGRRGGGGRGGPSYDFLWGMEGGWMEDGGGAAFGLL